MRTRNFYISMCDYHMLNDTTGGEQFVGSAPRPDTFIMRSGSHSLLLNRQDVLHYGKAGWIDRISRTDDQIPGGHELAADQVDTF
jgi:hypothetical protein